MRINWRVLTVALAIAVSSAHAEVRVWEGTLTLPTYEEGAPDPNPPFDQFAANRFNYPYTLRDNLTSRRVNHDWRAVYLENEYLKCSVLPDIGGHLYTCLDKLSGKSMFYDNPSIKKAAISYRGAWAAFGIEFNFPVSHNWVSMSPVNYSFSKHDDGSASVTVGNIDRVYGMEWTVELVLQPKSTLLEERITLNNRSDVRHRFYWWNNAGIRVWDDSQIVYPMRFAASHGFTEVRPWPVDDGLDLSIIRNHTRGPVSEFVHGSREGFMGIWNPQTKTGTVHFADYASLPAKKIWSWGADADGLDWRKALSDDNSAYVEVQGGLFRNQETYAFLEPRQTLQFSEYWMPVREIGGISRANLAGVASLTRRGGNLLVGFNANQAIPHASVSISNGTQPVFQEKTALTPEHAWVHEIPNAEAQSRYTIEIKDAKGATLLRQTEGVYDWTPESEIKAGPQTTYHIPAPDKRNLDDWIQSGKEDELNGRTLRALDTYKETLKRFPDSLLAQKSAGRLAAALLRYEEAMDYLETCHLRDTSDTEVSYYLGIAYDGLGETAHARTAYEQALRLPTFHSAASLRLGELLARTGDLGSAEKYLTEAFLLTPYDLRTREELVAVKRAVGKTDESQALSKAVVSDFPLSNFLKEEIGSPDLNQLANDADRILNIASQYIRLGMYQRALDVLSRKYPAPGTDQSEPGSVSPQENPLVAYFRGYCREKLGKSGADDYKLASTLSAKYIFPSTAEEFTVLKAASQANSADATAHFLLGTLYFSHADTDAALTQWSEARKAGAKLPVLDANTGLALLHIKHDPEKALEAFRDGLTNDPTNVAIYLGIDQSLSLLRHPARERVEALEKYPRLADAPNPLMFELILNLAEAGDFDRATNLFHNHFFPREEGGTNVRQVWVEVQLQRVVALAKQGHCSEAIDAAQHLGSAVPGLEFTKDGLEPLINSARTNYLLGTTYAACGKPEEAQAKFDKAASASGTDQTRWAWLAAQKLPNFDQAKWQSRLQTVLTDAINRTETSAYPSWWMYNAGALEQEMGKPQEADARFQKALLLPDRMLAYHFTRMEQSSSIKK
jgi:tetratricopeptide (TPR) repeat protein